MWNAALDKRENEVMRALLTLSAGKARFLASPAEVLSLAGVREGELERTLSSLAQDGYVDYIATERKGEPTFVVELRPKGMAYARTARGEGRRAAARLLLAAACGLLSALIGLAVRLLFSR